MRVGRVLFSLALGLLLASGTPIKGPSKSVSLPLHRHVSLYPSEDAQGQFPLSVNGIESLVYTIDVQVGSPPQRFNLTLDVNAGGAVLFRKGVFAYNQSCSTGDAKRNLFDPSLSKTFEAEIGGDLAESGGFYLDAFPYAGLECQKSLGTDVFLDGFWAWDTYQLGEVSVPSVLFVLANFTNEPLNPRWASDGVFPLDMSDALYTVLEAFGGNQEVSLFLNNAKPSDNQPVSGGRITFGGKNTQDCGDKWVTLQSNDYWGLPVNSVTIGTWSMDGDNAILSTSSPFLQVPLWFFRPVVVSTLGGTFDEDLDLYTVDCSKVDSLPSITINMGSGFGLIYTVKAQDYVAKIKGQKGVQCALLIVQGEDCWQLGTQFLPKRCMHLDYANNQVGFADPKN